MTRWRVRYAGLAALTVAVQLAATFGPVQAAQAQLPPIACTVSTAYLAQNSPTELFAGQFGAGSITFTSVGGPSTFTYNAIGLNPTNGYVYGVASLPTDRHIVRVHPTTGAVTDLGVTTPGLASPSNNIGVFDSAGAFYVMSSGTTTLNVVNVTTLTSTAITLSAAPVAGDLAFGPGGFLWGATGTVAPVDSIVRVNLGNGAVSFFPAPAAMTPATDFLGAAFTYGNGNIGLDRNSPGRLYQIAIANPASAAPTFTVVSSQTAPNSVGNDGTSCISAPTDLQIAKAGPVLVPATGPIQWSLTVTNNGPATSSGFTVTDAVPAGYTAVSATPGCIVTGNDLSCTGGTLSTGGSAVITLSATAPPGIGCLTNTATVLGNEAEPLGPLSSFNNTSSQPTCTSPILGVPLADLRVLAPAVLLVGGVGAVLYRRRRRTGRLLGHPVGV